MPDHKKEVSDRYRNTSKLQLNMKAQLSEEKASFHTHKNIDSYRKSTRNMDRGEALSGFVPDEDLHETASIGIQNDEYLDITEETNTPLVKKRLKKVSRPNVQTGRMIEGSRKMVSPLLRESLKEIKRMQMAKGTSYSPNLKKENSGFLNKFRKTHR